jgi:hypothetical protein
MPPRSISAHANILDRQRMSFKGNAGRFDGNDPGWTNQEIDILGQVLPLGRGIHLPIQPDLTLRNNLFSGLCMLKSSSFMPSSAACRLRPA